MNDFAAIDFETANQHRYSVCSVGVVIVRNGQPLKSLYELIRPEPNYYCRWTTEIHGLTRNDTDQADPFPIVWQRIAPELEGLTLVAHNSVFDEGCLRHAFQHFDMPYPNYRFRCTCRLSRKYLPQLPNHRLETVSEFVGYDLKNHHHALADAEACARIMLYLLENGMVPSEF